MNLLSPPKSYIDFRCYVHGLSGAELGPPRRNSIENILNLRERLLVFAIGLTNKEPSGCCQ